MQSFPFIDIDHEWMMKFVKARIQDPRVLRLVSVMLKAGVVRDMVFEPTEQGSGQGQYVEIGIMILMPGFSLCQDDGMKCCFYKLSVLIYSA